VRRFSEVARALGQAPATLAIAWCLRNPNVSSVILGASRVSQLLQNLQALDVLEQVDAAGWARSKPSSPRGRPGLGLGRAGSAEGTGTGTVESTVSRLLRITDCFEQQQSTNSRLYTAASPFD
jgi:hypothetical protein